VAMKSGFSDVVESMARPIARGIGRTGITPNWMTTFGLVLTGAATWSVATGELVLGAAFLIAGGLMDLFDGAVARATGKTTPFGGFYDSVSDRISDGAILAGVAWYLVGQPRVFALAVTALVAAQVTSYVRAKAESIDLSCSIGIMERGERAILLIVGLFFHRWLLEPVLWMLAVGSTFTVVQRVHHVWCQIERDIPEELLELVMADKAWSKAFTRAARRFYGERNFDGAIDEARSGGTSSDRDGDGSQPGPTVTRPSDRRAERPAERGIERPAEPARRRFDGGPGLAP
jgi:CDP-diacylglycerol---glycerol-3-phosphate 3-phosphatidyltransferase